MDISPVAVQVWGVILTLATVIGFLWRKVGPVLRRVGHFLDDFLGEEERPGIPARPGVLERLQAVEVALAEVRYHVQPNGGRSAHDRLIERVDTLAARLDEHIAASATSHQAIYERLDALARKE